MADPTGQPVQPGERRGMSVPQRIMLLAIVYMFIKRYVGDGSVQKAGPRSTASVGSTREVPLAPLVKEARVPDPVARPRHAHAALDDPDDEFAGLDVSGASDQREDPYPGEVEKAMPLPVADPSLVDTVSLATRSSGAGSRAGTVPQVLVQYCVS